MGKEKLKSLLTAYSPDGVCLAIFSPDDGVVKAWNTDNGNQIGEWKETDGGRPSCITCGFIGKMRRNKPVTWLVALGTDSGDVSLVNISAGQLLWKSSGHSAGGITSLFLRRKEGRLLVIGTSGVASELILEDGKPAGESYKLSKKSVISAAYLTEDDKFVAAAGRRIRVVSMNDGEEVGKLTSSLDSIRSVSGSEDAKFVVACADNEKRLEVWKCNFNKSDETVCHFLPMKHRPLRIDCRNGLDEEDDLVVLAVSDSGVAYVWKIKSFSDDASPTKISMKDGSSEQEPVTASRKSKKSRLSVFAARIHALEDSGLIKVQISYGSVDTPQFTVIDVSTLGEEIVVDAAGVTSLENGASFEEDGASKQKKSKKKRGASDMEVESEVALVDDGQGDPKDSIQVDYDLNEPTVAEKLAILNLSQSKEVVMHEKSSALAKPPSADSVHVLLKQALHADDRALLIDCLFRQDEKIITNSVAMLNTSDVLKLLQSLVPIIQTKGAVLACTLPWLRSLLIQHASELMSQESSLHTLNTLYQLIESRVSNFNQTLQLASTLDLFAASSLEMDDDESDEAIAPAIYEDKDEESEDDDDASAEEMDIESGEEEEEDGDKEPEILSDISDFEDMELVYELMKPADKERVQMVSSGLITTVGRTPEQPDTRAEDLVSFMTNNEAKLYLVPYLRPAHWELLAIVPENRVIYRFDSLQQTIETELTQLLKMVERSCPNKIPDSNELLDSNWRIVDIKHKKQTGDWECGYYVMIWMHKIAIDIQSLDLEPHFPLDESPYEADELKQLAQKWCEYVSSEVPN